ncbi:putative signal-transduction protein containing cAMP-binding and CBS domains isoform 2 [Galdieria sulphuraria]|uniref:Putative signal-transduction protein containing cAMP-binding and CBS domains isoform 2 n=2 Tax=Galdieria sulphuraria TaxID=130081 RepID=M2XXH9_GALSU|nr:putative signal-transduction protein containing cAMP-binding and CBS domains isoform 2 [Galdieria sulphuraria]EME28328.1 putative signal-transduction protein containing cAMP-binding and CBS domains isoform 2 [Galdieria sulphuraria]|eukprot:XP_005704848.1 putative signal-transduction protein containing cAMP-binding and CBS domains isoform 2 [Galdieria sulphuraria]
MLSYFYPLQLTRWNCAGQLWKKQLLGKRYSSGAVNIKTVEHSPFWSRSLKQLLGSHQFSDKNVIAGESTVRDALEQMEKVDMSIVAVTGTQNDWLGIFSERDLIRLIARGGNINNMYVRDALSKKEGVATCFLNQRVSDLGKIFTTQNVQNIVVMKESSLKNTIHDLAGLITSRELAQYFHSMEPAVVEEFEHVLVKDMLDHNKSKVHERLNEQSILAVELSSQVKDAVHLMAKYGVGCVMVTSDHSKGALHPYPDVIGMFTEREYIRNCLLKGKDKDNCRVGDVMQSNMALVTPEFSAAQFIRLFADSHVRYLPVFSTSPEDAQDSTSMCLGLFSIKDIFFLLFSSG